MKEQIPGKQIHHLLLLLFFFSFQNLCLYELVKRLERLISYVVVLVSLKFLELIKILCASKWCEVLISFI